MSVLDSSGYGKQPLTFEFTKRKRWADLLISELADGINMILSTSRKVLYCGPAITELIGWRDVDFLDCDLLDFITPDGRDSFTASFDESIEKNTELLSYIRLKCSDNASSSSEYKDMAFEIKGHPHVMSEHEQEGRCFFATAKAYPSRNTAMLNTYLELKTENEQLQRRLLELRSRVPTQTLPAPSPMTSQTSPIYATSSLQPQKERVLPAPTVPSQGSVDASNSYYPATSINSGPIDDLPSATGNLFDSKIFNAGPSLAPPSVTASSSTEDEEEGSKKKKPKKSHLGEQYVCITCGRTDSPEWRKGPLGPKTLCNACGLRWAKQMRKTDDPAEGGVEASGSN